MTPLREATDPQVYGGKAAGLARALAAGLPVPDGWVLRPGDSLDPSLLAGPVAVRSSAIGEDGVRNSFAGQFLTVLGAVGASAVADAVASVRASSAGAYRARSGASIGGVAAVLQPLIDARVAGVLFTRDPVTGTDVRVVEASWGLGESVVQGTVVPDRARIDRSGAVLDYTVGIKDEAVRFVGQGVAPASVDADRAETRCLDAAMLAALAALADAVERAFVGACDIEWAFDADGTLFLLQCRPVTR